MNVDPLILAPVLTVLFGGVLSGVVTYALNAQRAERDMYRQKLETLFASADQYATNIATHFITYYPAVKGEISYNELLDLQIKNKPEGGVARSIEMLVPIYFPKVQPDYDKFQAARARLADFAHEFKVAYMRGAFDRVEHLKSLNAALTEHDVATKQLLRAVLAQAKWINRPWWKVWGG